MTRVGVTMRVHVPESRGERWDCLDQALSKLLHDAGLLPVPLPNVIDGVLEFVAALEIDALVLSGGNDLATVSAGRDTAPERDRLESALVTMAMTRRIPIVGICRGAQMLSSCAGGRLVSDPTHAGTRHGVRMLTEWAGLPSGFEVNSYHRWVIPADALGDGFRPVALAADGASVEAFEHRREPAIGIMWHPERAGAPQVATGFIIAHLQRQAGRER